MLDTLKGLTNVVYWLQNEAKQVLASKLLIYQVNEDKDKLHWTNNGLTRSLATTDVSNSLSTPKASTICLIRSAR